MAKGSRQAFNNNDYQIGSLERRQNNSTKQMIVPTKGVSSPKSQNNWNVIEATQVQTTKNLNDQKGRERIQSFSTNQPGAFVAPNKTI